MNRSRKQREWRIISRPIFCDRLVYREGKSLIVPYYRLPLWEGNQKLELQEVVIGPTPDANKSKSSFTSLIMSQEVVMPGTGGTNGTVSKAPYRDW